MALVTPQDLFSCDHDSRKVEPLAPRLGGDVRQSQALGFLMPRTVSPLITRVWLLSCLVPRGTAGGEPVSMTEQKPRPASASQPDPVESDRSWRTPFHRGMIQGNSQQARAVSPLVPFRSQPMTLSFFRQPDLNLTDYRDATPIYSCCTSLSTEKMA